MRAKRFFYAFATIFVLIVSYSIVAGIARGQADWRIVDLQGRIAIDSLGRIYRYDGSWHQFEQVPVPGVPAAIYIPSLNHGGCDMTVAMQDGRTYELLNICPGETPGPWSYSGNIFGTVAGVPNDTQPSSWGKVKDVFRK